MLSLARSPSCPPLACLVVISGRVHVSQNQRARIDPSPFARVDKIDAQLFDGAGNFSHALGQCSRKRRSAFAAVDCCQRLHPVLGSWNDSIGARARRSRKQPVDPFGGKVRQIAGDNQIPSRARCGQSGDDSREGPTSESICPSLGLHIISDHMQSEFRVSTGRSDNRDLGDEWLDESRRTKNQRDAAQIEKSLVAAHARAGAPSKNKASDLTIALHDGTAILRLPAELAQRSGEL